VGENHEKLWTKSFVVLTVCNFLLFLNLQMILPSLPSYVKDVFHASNFTVSLVTSLFALSAIVARVFAGQALRRGKRNLMIFLGLVVALLATAGYYWCGTIVMFLLMRMLYGVGFGMASTTFPTMTSNVIPPRRMGEGMGYFGLSTSLAMSIGPTIGLTLLRQYGFGSLIVGATLVVAAIFPLTWLVRSLLKQPEPAVVPSQGAAAKRGPFIERAILLPFSLNFLLSIAYGGLLGFMALFGKEAHLANVGYFFLANAVSVLLVRPISGKIYDKKGHRALLIPGAVLVIAGLLLVSYTTTMTMLVIAALVFGSGFGIMQPTLQTWTIQASSPEYRGMANGMFLNSIDLGVAIGSMLLGTIAMSTSYAVMFRISIVFMVLFVAVYSVVIFGRGARRKAAL
jgi:MFS family permease